MLEHPRLSRSLAGVGESQTWVPAGLVGTWLGVGGGAVRDRAGREQAASQVGDQGVPHSPSAPREVVSEESWLVKRA